MNSKKIVLDCINRVYRNGLTTTSGGNLSVRDEENNIFITPSGKDKGTLEEKDIVQVTASGQKIGDYKPSIELPFHSKIYKIRPEINAVLHVHSPYLVSYSLLNSAPDTAVCWQYYKTSQNVGLSLYDIPGSIELGEQIAKFIAKGYDSVMMQNHGAVCIASDMPTAYKMLENLENCAKTCLYAKRLNGVKPLSKEVLTQYIEYYPSIAVKGAENSYKIEKEKICEFCKRTIEHGYFSAGIGVISQRVGQNEFLITPCEYDRGNLTAEQIVLVRDGVAFGGKPDSGWKLHKAIYDKKDYVNGIFSGCPSSIMAYGISQTPIDSRTLPESYIMMRDIERLATLSDINDIDRVATTFSPATHVAIVENSCVIATGETITKAFDRFEVSEITAKNYLLASVLGTPTPITKEEIAKIDKYFDLPEKN